MEIAVLKVGLISCSGEAHPGGTVSRVACREVLSHLRPAETVTLCLPLFIAGGEEERRFAAKFPTITVDGCEKRCAQKATEKLSGRPSRSLVVPEILERRGLRMPEKRRGLGPQELAVCGVVAEEIARATDEVLEEV
jgi:uncharacterized metal-binding protein